MPCRGIQGISHAGCSAKILSVRCVDNHCQGQGKHPSPGLPICVAVDPECLLLLFPDYFIEANN